MARAAGFAPVAPTAGVMLLSLGLVAVSYVLAFPTVGTSPLVVVAMLACVAVLVRVRLRLAPGWVAWRWALAWLAGVAAAYPGVWAVAALVSERAPGGLAAWATAVLAGVAHLPVVAAFSLLQLLAVHYLTRGPTRWASGVVVGLGALAAVAFAVFFDDFRPFAAEALVQWRAGETVGMVVTLAFLSTVLVGPVVVLLAAWREEGAATRRLGLVGAGALTGAALVMVCGSAGALAGAGDTAVLVGMYAALAVVGVGTTRALTTPYLPARPHDAAPDADPDHTPGEGTVPLLGRSVGGRGDGRLTPREAEVLSLLVAGLSNAGIAARLVVSERTVDAHLRSVFTKLDLPDGPADNRRVHAALWWAQASEGEVRAG